jgi:hypothetical protein
MEARQEHRGTQNQIRVKPDAGIRESTAYRHKSAQRATSSQKDRSLEARDRAENQVNSSTGMTDPKIYAAATSSQKQV